MQKLGILIGLLCWVATSWAPISWAQTPAQFTQAVEAYEQKDYTRAFKLFQSLAQSGDRVAQFNLGYLYEQGIGVDNNIKQAVHWYEKAAVQGHPGAFYNLAYLFDQGKKIKGDPKVAARLYLNAAKFGHTQAMVNLGLLYFQGKGVKKNLREAYAWSALAASRGNLRALKNKDLIAIKLSPLEISSAESLYRKRRKQYVDPFLQKQNKH